MSSRNLVTVLGSMEPSRTTLMASEWARIGSTCNVRIPAFSIGEGDSTPVRRGWRAGSEKFHLDGWSRNPAGRSTDLLGFGRTMLGFPLDDVLARRLPSALQDLHVN